MTTPTRLEAILNKVGAELKLGDNVGTSAVHIVSTELARDQAELAALLAEEKAEVLAIIERTPILHQLTSVGAISVLMTCLAYVQATVICSALVWFAGFQHPNLFKVLAFILLLKLVIPFVSHRAAVMPKTLAERIKGYVDNAIGSSLIALVIWGILFIIHLFA